MSSAPQPSLLFSFNGSNVDSVTNLSPSSTTGTPSFVPGNYGSSIQLTNTQGSAPATYLTYNTIPAISNATGFTISFWLNSPSITSTSNCLGISASDDVFFQLTSSTAGFSGWNVTGTTAPSFTIPAGKWVNYALTVNTTTWNQYINGTLWTTSGYTAASTSLTSISGPLTVGTTPTITNGAAISIQDLRVYNSALSTSQILGIYQSRGIPPRLTLTGASPSQAWQFEGTPNDTITGLTAASSPNISYYPGLYQQAVAFNNPTASAPTSYIISNQSAQTFSNTNGFSFSFWMNWSAVPLATQYVMGIYSGPSLNNGIYELVRFVFRGANTPPTFNMFPGSAGGGNSTSFNFTPTVGVWYNFMGTVNNTTWTIYLNGVFQVSSVATGTTSNITSFNPSVHVGVSLYGGGVMGLNGLVDDTRLYNTALSTPQIFGIYQSKGIPPSLTLSGATGGLPNPNYAWQFEGTTVDVGGLQGTNFGPGSLTGGSTFTSSPPVGNYSTAISFPSSTARIVTNTYTNLYNPGRCCNVFVESWIYISSASACVAMGGSPVSTCQWWCGVNSSGYFSANVYTGSAQITATCTAIVPTNTWTHVAFVYQQNTATSNTLFVWTNGANMGLTTTSSPATGGGLITIGGDGSTTSIPNGSYISDLRVIMSGNVPTASTFTPKSSPFTLSPFDYAYSGGPEVLYTIQTMFSNSFATGKYGQALSNTVIQYSTALFPSGTPMTATLWINITGAIRYTEPIFNVTPFNFFILNTAGLPYNSYGPYQIVFAYSSQQYTQGNTSLNTWTHLAASISATGYISLYINGVNQSTLTNPQQSAPSATTSIIVGGNVTGTFSAMFKGLVDDVRIYNQVLSAAQIQTIYQSGGNLYGANLVQPSLLFSLNGTTNDSIKGVVGVVGGTLGTTQYVTGNYGQAFNFLNTQGSVATDYITATQSAVTFSNTAGFSASFWVNPTPASTATQYWFGIFNGTEILRGSVTSGASPNGLQVFFGATGASYPTTRTFIPSLQWSHVAFVINTTTISMYVNGVYQPLSSGAYTSTGLSSFTGPIILGTSQAGSNFGLTGYMQDFRMYTTALSAQQIQGIYLSGGARPSAVLTSG